MSVENFSIHLAFSTLPAGSENEFVRTKRRTFSQYVSDIERCMITEAKIDSYLYKPLVFHLFGTFDVVFISLINNYKFCQKVFDIDSSPLGATTSYQIVTGICDNNFLKKDITTYFQHTNDLESKLSKHKFVHITNFKVNNGLLIGNGNHLINLILNKISTHLNGSDFILFKSFNWSEIILIQFNDDVGLMQKNVILLRELNLGKICDDASASEISKNSLYGYINDQDLFKGESDVNLVNSHVFVDTHSYTGVDYFEFNKSYNEENPYIDDKFKSSIELQVKPGHFRALYDLLEKNTTFDETKLKFKNGKTDYLVRESNYTEFLSNYNVNQEYRHGNGDVMKHIRKWKTNFLFDICGADGRPFSELFEIKDSFENTHGIVNFSKLLAKNYTIDISDLKVKIKKLGVSRQLREKILKAFSNYNNLIKDTILYGEFIELRDYMIYIKSDIEEEVAKLDSFFEDTVRAVSRTDSSFMSLRNVEKKWTKLLEIYENAYHNRVHNNYLYEDLNEFSIDFNSAVNQINSIHDYIVKITNNVFFPTFTNKIIVTQNEIDSKSNIVNVNYNVYHYLEPALIFTTLFKEVMNGVENKAAKADEDVAGKEFVGIKFQPEYFKTVKEDVLYALKGEFSDSQNRIVDNFDFFYFFSDLAKMSYTFLFDYELYEYWSWTYFLQDSSLYKTNGLPDNELFQKELLRISLIKKVFEGKGRYVKCPAPEIFDLWQKSIVDIDNLSQLIVSNAIFKEALYKFSKFILIEALLRGKDDDINDVDEYNIFIAPYLLQSKTVSVEDLRNFDERVHEGIAKLIYTKDYKINTQLHSKFKLITHQSLAIQYQLKNNLEIDSEKLLKIKNGGFYFICAMSNATLSLFKGEDDTPNILRRDWKEGVPLAKFSSEDVPRMFVDPFGGFFYNTPEILNENFKYTNRIIDYLWHISEIEKKQLFNNPNQ